MRFSWLAVNQVSSQHRVTLLGWLLVDSSRFSSENPWKALELQVKSIVSSIVFRKGIDFTNKKLWMETPTVPQINPLTKVLKRGAPSRSRGNG